MKPCVAQYQSIPEMLQNKDLILQSSSNSGKTTAFLISILQLIDPTSSTFQALILTPRRDLALIIHQIIREIGAHLNVGVEAIVGGLSLADQMENLKEGKHQIVVGTPGRIVDIMKTNVLKFDNLKIFVLDEADEMLGRGFQEQITQITNHLPPLTQNIIVSSTLPPDVLSIAKDLMKDPVKKYVKNMALFIEKIKQWYIRAPKEEWKFDTLSEIFSKLNIWQSIIHCNSELRVNELAQKLEGRNHKIFVMHENLSENQKADLLKKYSITHHRKVLITNDHFLPDFDTELPIHLINYEMPSKKQSYILQIEKIEPCNSNSMVINLIIPQEEEVLDEIKNHYKDEIKELILDAINFP